MTELHVAYVGPVSFGSSSAEAQRMLGIAQALRAAGDRVSVGSAAWPGEDIPSQGDPGLTVTPVGELPLPGWPKLRRVWRGLSWGRATREWIERLEPAPDAIVLYGTSIGYLLRLLPLARRRRIPLVIDAVEWYQASHLPGGSLGPFALANQVSMRLLAPHATGVIAISRFLGAHFDGRGVPVLRIPPLFQTDRGVPVRAAPPHPLTVSYLGSAGKKDRRTIRSLVLLPGALGADPGQLRVNIVGLTAAAAAQLLGGDAPVEHPCLHFHGRLPAADARRVMATSHFSALQRGRERYARAGFPSKVPESLVLGVPVLANLTSDLGDHLVHGVNARVLSNDRPEALAAAVAAALTEHYAFDREAIAESARAVFSPARYSRPLHYFLVRLTEVAARREHVTRADDPGRFDRRGHAHGR
ncbi:glycosyltransferase [Cryobacterium sp. MLB-32]|uniref:glycosyltransferase n=1 Tax=Cryobacterium sp. MLB-32 TaxID=1529318 RepID=UPI00055AE55E|nr:glycosyltransferase [Cryobacterium sp. MLB-32]